MSADAGIVWPSKKRELVKWVADSRVWNDFVMRDDDIVVCTWSKSGTTLTQQILGQLISGGKPGLNFSIEASPWIDFRLRPEALAIANAQTTRRVLKTHLPIDALPWSRQAKYIYIGRDGRDVFWSWYNHWSSFKPEVLARISSFYPDEPPIPYPDPDVRLAFLKWLDDAYPNWPFWPHVQGWFDARHTPNLMLLHFANLRADPEGEIRKLAAFLDIEIAADALPRIVEQSSFDYVKSLAATDPKQAPFLKGGGDTFINKGTNGRWRDILTPADIARYESEAARNLTPECAHWLATGEMA
jgi:aryl sulfotransferase